MVQLEDRAIAWMRADRHREAHARVTFDPIWGAVGSVGWVGWSEVIPWGPRSEG